MYFQIYMYKYPVCQREPQSSAVLLAQRIVESRTSKVDTDEITFSVDHVLDGTLCQRLPTSGRQEKYCAALSQIACYAEFTLHPRGEVSRISGIPRRYMTESGRVCPNLKYRPSVSVERPAANSLCPPEYVSSSLSSAKLFHERVSRTCESRSGSYLACTFKVCPIFEN